MAACGNGRRRYLTNTRTLSLLRFILDFQQTFSTIFIMSWYVTFFLWCFFLAMRTHESQLKDWWVLRHDSPSSRTTHTA